MIDWLLGTLLATSGLVVLVLLIREPVRRHFGARVAYGLWLIPAARLLMPTLSETVERTVPAPSPIQPLSAQVSLEPMLLASVAPPEPSLLDQLGGWPTMLLTLWLGGAAGLFLGRMIAFSRQRRTILDRSVEIGRIGSIRLVRSKEVSGPLAFGIFDRVIAVPSDFERLYGERERRLALEHELAHHHSGDLVANLFAFVLLCLQWFNPLAWVAHAAFRFDQEAACDARVLDKVKAQDRADYGRAIAKAASGRALLFASALDRRNTLHRRLKSMLTNPSSGRRTAGRLIVLAAAAAALPLTATRAIEYVDKVEPVAPSAPAASAVAAIAASAAAPAAPAAPASPAPSPASEAIHSIHVDKGLVTVNGKTKRWSELTPEEKADIRRSIADARRELAEHRVDRVEIQREIREAMAEARINRVEVRRDLAEARTEIEQAIREIDVHAADIRRSGQDPERIKAQVRASLKSIERIDVSPVDGRAIEASVSAADAAIAKAQAEIERIDVLIDKDD